MRPPARVQAAIELLDDIIIAARDNGASADNIIKKYFRARRYAGSKDRRAVRELVYGAIRRFGERPANGRAAMVGLAKEQPELAVLFDGSDHGPAVLADNEEAASGGVTPKWLLALFAQPVNEAEIDALFGRAALDIRAVSEKVTPEKIAEIWSDMERLALPGSYRLPAGTPLDAYELYREGKLEVQDLGSQAVVHVAAAHQPERVLDLCAGAGGKALGLAASLPDTARIIASDTDRNRLRQIEPRIARSGTKNIETILLSPKKERDSLSHLTEKCDLVIVDAPCTGTGTWRRNPELRWRMTPKRLAQITELQQRLFTLGSEMVKPGGRLVYVVCSLLDDEGADQTAAFLKLNSCWQHVTVDLPLGRPYRKGENDEGVLLTPYHDGTDGFYFAVLEKICQ